MPPISVLIADDKEARRGLCLNLLQHEKGIQVLVEAQTDLEVVTSTVKQKPRILLLSLNLLKGNGGALLFSLRQKSPGTRIILLTRVASEGRILEALCRGARGYLEEKVLSTFLPKAVRCVDAGEAWVPRKMVARIIDRLASLTAGSHDRL
jgi:DNA-binding NarL/FixJ family response regulator